MVIAKVVSLFITIIIIIIISAASNTIKHAPVLHAGSVRLGHLVVRLYQESITSRCEKTKTKDTSIPPPSHRVDDPVRLDALVGEATDLEVAVAQLLVQLAQARPHVCRHWRVMS